MVPEEDKIVELEFCSIMGQSRVAMNLFYNTVHTRNMDRGSLLHPICVGSVREFISPGIVTYDVHYRSRWPTGQGFCKFRGQPAGSTMGSLSDYS
jgi:hypothetical protein